MDLSNLDLPMEIMKLLEDDTVGTLHVKKIWCDPQAKLYIPSSIKTQMNLVLSGADWSVRAVLNCISAISVHFSVPTKNLTDIKGRKCSILALNCTFLYNQLNMPEYSQRL